MYTELTAGYHVDPERLINGAVFDVDYCEMVVVKDIPFYSLCEHHLLPFFGTAAVAYIPRGRVIGLSKIPRIVEMYARRLQVQERMTQQIADFLQDRLDPQGVGVVVEATHLCAVMRGIRKPGTVMTTSAVLGLFRTRDRTRAEFFAHLDRAGARGLAELGGWVRQDGTDLRDRSSGLRSLRAIRAGETPMPPFRRTATIVPVVLIVIVGSCRLRRRPGKPVCTASDPLAQCEHQHRREPTSRRSPAARTIPAM